MTRNKLIGFKKSTTAFNGTLFETFLLEIIQCLRVNSMANHIFVMDNVAFHKMAHIRAAIEQAGHSHIFLPPYSPQLNPIEEVFSKWKGFIKNENCNDLAHLLRAISIGHTTITEDDCRNYFDHMATFIGKALQNEVF